MQRIASFTPVSTGRPSSGYARRISQAEWSKHEETIRHLHGQSATHVDMLQYLDRTCDFQPSLSQLVSQLKRWNLSKYKPRLATLEGIESANPSADSQVPSTRSEDMSEWHIKLNPILGLKTINLFRDLGIKKSANEVSTEVLLELEILADILCSARLFSRAFEIYACLYAISFHVIENDFGIGLSEKLWSLSKALCVRSKLNCLRSAANQQQWDLAYRQASIVHEQVLKGKGEAAYDEQIQHYLTTNHLTSAHGERRSMSDTTLIVHGTDRTFGTRLPRFPYSLESIWTRADVSTNTSTKFLPRHEHMTSLTRARAVHRIELDADALLPILAWCVSEMDQSSEACLDLPILCCPGPKPTSVGSCSCFRHVSSRLFIAAVNKQPTSDLGLKISLDGNILQLGLFDTLNIVASVLSWHTGTSTSLEARYHNSLWRHKVNSGTNSSILARRMVFAVSKALHHNLSFRSVHGVRNNSPLEEVIVRSSLFNHLSPPSNNRSASANLQQSTHRWNDPHEMLNYDQSTRGRAIKKPTLPSTDTPMDIMLEMVLPRTRSHIQYIFFSDYNTDVDVIARDLAAVSASDKVPTLTTDATILINNLQDPATTKSDVHHKSEAGPPTSSTTPGHQTLAEEMTWSASSSLRSFHSTARRNLTRSEQSPRSSRCPSEADYMSIVSRSSKKSTWSFHKFIVASSTTSISSSMQLD